MNRDEALKLYKEHKIGEHEAFTIIDCYADFHLSVEGMIQRGHIKIVNGEWVDEKAWWKETYHKGSGRWTLKSRIVDEEKKKIEQEYSRKLDLIQKHVYKDYKEKTCPYSIIGVTVGTAYKSVRRKALKLIRDLHPDINPTLYTRNSLYGEHYLKGFKAIMNAFNTLKRQANA